MNYNTEIKKIAEELINKHTREVLQKEEAIRTGADLLKKGEIVAFPTETVYGLGADATDPEAVKKIFTAKGRPADNPLIVHIAGRKQLAEIMSGDLSGAALKLITAYWPGPLTIIVEKKETVPDITTAGLDSVGIRMPSHPVARALLNLTELPVAAPSANSSGYPSPTKAEHVYHDLTGEIPLIIDGGSCPVGVESTVVDVRKPGVEILRPGGITVEDISSLLGYEVPVKDSEGETEKAAPPSPGMKYRHYSPRTPLIIVSKREINNPEQIGEQYNLPGFSPGETVWVLTGETVDELGLPEWMEIRIMGSRDNPATIARRLFALLRELDNEDYILIAVEELPAGGLGRTVMNRLHKAALNDLYLK